MIPRRWLLLRGLVREARHWGDFPEALRARGLDVVTLDLPGVATAKDRRCPWTVPEMVDDLRDRLPPSPEPTGVYAQSLGGMLALDWAARYPGDFARVVVCNTSARDLSSLRERLSWTGRQLLVRALLSPRGLRRERLTLQLIANTAAARAQAERFAAYSLDAPIPVSVFFRQLVAAARHASPPEVRAPVLVLGSEGDRMVSVRCSHAVARRYRAPLAVHPDGGHDLPLDDPHWVAARIAGE